MRDDTAGQTSLARSEALFDRCQGLIPRHSQTNSKAPDQFVRGVAPTHIERGKGSHVWDVDGNEYIDYPMARGPIILGHNFPDVTEAVEEQLQDGTAYSMPHPLQVEVAERIRDAVPCAEMVRFAKNGHDVTTLAAKLARAYTGRDVIATQGYHGWPDVWSGAGGANLGIPQQVCDLTETFEYNDIESLERIFEQHQDDVAAIVTTPVDSEPPEDDFLERVREIADREDAVLVFDEIITGFRFALGGAQEYFEVTPDLACFAKGISNGFPISAIAGREDIMEMLSHDEFIFSLTYGGEVVSLAAANQCLRILEEEDVFEHIFEKGQNLMDGYNEIAADHGLDDVTDCYGFPPRSNMGFDPPGHTDEHVAESLFMQECLKRGILFDSIHFPTFSHTDEDVEYTLEVYDEAMGVLREAIDEGTVAARLEGEPIGSSIMERTGTN